MQMKKKFNTWKEAREFGYQKALRNSTPGTTFKIYKGHRAIVVQWEDNTTAAVNSNFNDAIRDD